QRSVPLIHLLVVFQADERTAKRAVLRTRFFTAGLSPVGRSSDNTFWWTEPLNGTFRTPELSARSPRNSSVAIRPSRYVPENKQKCTVAYVPVSKFILLQIPSFLK